MNLPFVSCTKEVRSPALLRVCASGRNMLPLLALLLALPAALPGQTASATPAIQPAAKPAEDEPVLTLSPFQVVASGDVGYMARNTLGGTRLNSSLRDVSSQVSVMIQEFLQDIAATNLEDAFAYSLNVENLREFNSTTGGGTDDYYNGAVNIKNSFRVRGLGTGSLAHDYFVTDVRVDTYNTERFTLSSGPNSILFGLGSPAGLSDATYKRARFGRVFGSVGLRVDSNESLRTTIDLNVPVWKDKLAVRFSLLDEKQVSAWSPVSDNNQRKFATLTFQPFRHTQVRAWYEDIYENRYPVRNAVIRDFVTPWLSTGQPEFDNAGLTTSAQITSKISALGLGNVFARYANGERVLNLGQLGVDPFISTWSNTVETRGPHVQRTDPVDSTQVQALQDPTVFPRYISYNGNGTRNLTDAWIAGASIEHTFFDKLFVEIGYNREKRNNPWSDLIRGNQTLLYRDMNKYLNDGKTPNPGYNKYYVTGVAEGGWWYSEREDARAMAAYDLDLTKTSKWLGRHRLAALISQDNTIETSVPQGARLRVISDTSYTTGTATTHLTDASRIVRVRAYLDDPRDGNSQGVYWASFPWDGFSNYTMPDGTVLGGVYNPYGLTASGELKKNQVDSRMFVAQSYWLKDHLVTTIGVRKDKLKESVIRASRRTSDANSAYIPFWEMLDKFPDWQTTTSGTTRTFGAVAHLTDWLSVHYSQSSTLAPANLGHNPDNSVIPGSHGEGKDYGLTLMPFGEKVYLRINRYDQTSGPVNSGFQGQIRSPIIALERSVLALGAAPHATFDPELGSYYVVSESLASKGFEAELIANPTPNWRVSLSVSKSEAVRSDIAPSWRDFVLERSQVWGQYGDQMMQSGSVTIRDYYFGLVDNFNLMSQTEGQKVESGREWRVNATTRYSFHQGRLKGVFVGGTCRWRSENAVGYAAKPVENEFPFPGIADTIVVSDINSPIYGDPTLDIDAFAGYSRKLFKNRIDWRIQLNVRNLFDDNTIIKQSVYSDGSLRLYGLQTPREFIVTSSFGF